MSDRADVSPLFAVFARGEISAEQLETLQTALREDCNLRREFIEYMNIDSALSDLAALSAAEVAEIESTPIGSDSRSIAAGESSSIDGSDVRHGQTLRRAALVGTVAATVLITAILWFANPDGDADVPVAKLVTNVDAKLLRNGQPFTRKEFGTGEYRLAQGLLHLRFASGVMVYVEAPARFDAVNAKRLLLHSGRLSASAPPEGVGFTVETPEAEVTDFGTEFSIDVEAGASEVHVFEGLVRVKPKLRKNGEPRDAVDLRTSQAIKIEDATAKPVDIELANDRFIRNFDEPKRRYPRSVKELSPVAYYRMPIRVKGLHCEPREFSGEVLTGEGFRPPHAPGFVGASLRVLANSTGRGGRVNSPRSLVTGRFTLAVFVYLEALTPGGTVATNIRADRGSFALSIDEEGRVHAMIRDRDGELQSATGESALALKTWRQLVMSVDGGRLRLYEDGQLTATTPCSLIADSDSETLWFGTDSDGVRLWNGRIDELALFDRALRDKEVAGLYLAAQEEVARSK